MSDAEGRLFGSQFDASRFEKGQDSDGVVVGALEDAFDAKNVASVEGDEVYDNYRENKDIHELMDYTGIDYLVDTFEDPIFGVNHRNHFNKAARFFDIRAKTGTKAPSELEKLRKAGPLDIVPKYASRMKAPGGFVEWFRIVDLEKFIEELDNGLPHTDVWDGDRGVVAWLYDYGDLRERGIVVDEIKL